MNDKKAEELTEAMIVAYFRSKGVDIDSFDDLMRIFRGI